MVAGLSHVTLAEAARRTGLATDRASMASVCDELGVVTDGRVDLGVFDGGKREIDLEMTFSVMSSGRV